MKKKSMAMFWWFVGLFGILGFHRFYLGKKITGVIWLFSAGGLLIGTIYDFLNMDRLVASANGSKANDHGENKKSKNDHVEDAFMEKKKRGHYASYGKAQVLGGLLPKSGSIGNVKIQFDGKFPYNKGSRGAITIYQTEGHLQVFYTDPKDIENMDFIAQSVDKYQM